MLIRKICQFIFYLYRNSVSQFTAGSSNLFFIKSGKNIVINRQLKPFDSRLIESEIEDKNVIRLVS